MIDTSHLKIFSVAKVNNYLKSIIENDVILSDLWIEGEISNFKKTGSGHLYFTMKDGDELAAINCVMFKNSALDIGFDLEDGMKILAYGRCSLYEKTGQYQFYVEFVEIRGQGNLHISFEKLKRKLYDEGLFDIEHKKNLPFLPNRIGVITSETGSVIQDIISVVKRLNPLTKITLIPTSVQGEHSKLEILNAFDILEKWNKQNKSDKIDVVILARGGGSFEDLNVFNEEEIARVIFACKTPIISAVGHETDITISDFVCDQRAGTPSIAAEMATTKLSYLTQILDGYTNKLYESMIDKISECNNNLLLLKNRKGLENPINNIRNNKKYLEETQRKLHKAIKIKLELDIMKLNSATNILESVSPLSVLKRGYSVITNNENKLISSSKDVKSGDIINIKFQDEEVKATIN